MAPGLWYHVSVGTLPTFTSTDDVIAFLRQACDLLAPSFSDLYGLHHAVIVVCRCYLELAEAVLLREGVASRVIARRVRICATL